MSINAQANIALGWAQQMSQTAAKVADPATVQDPGKLVMFQQEMSNATLGYELSARTMQKLNEQDKLLSELLRDA